MMKNQSINVITVRRQARSEHMAYHELVKRFVQHDAIRSGNIADLVRFDRPGKTRRINVDTLKGQPSLVMDADNLVCSI